MRTSMIWTVTLVVSALLSAPEPARAVNLAAFLAEVENAGRFESPARADLRIHVKQAGHEQHHEGVVVYRGADAYLELRDPPLRLLIRAGDNQVHEAVASPAEGASRRSVYEPMGGTTLIADDFRPFHGASLRIPQISSETKKALLVSAAPVEPSPYVLLVYLLDRDKLLPTRVQYYERTINNLVRMRRETDAVQVAGAWRPGRTEIEDYRTGAVTTIERRWIPGPEVPAELFDPATFLRSPSLLTPP